MRLIDANELKKKMCFKCNDEYSDEPCDPGDCVFCNAINDAQTIDAVSVVRCRECKHWTPSGSKGGNSFSEMEYIGGCEFTKYCRRESDFCSYGERKEGDE